MAAPDLISLPQLDYMVLPPTPIRTAIPDADDVLAARRFARVVANEGLKKGASSEARKAAIVYEHQVVHAAAAAAGGPPMDALQAIIVRMDQMKAELQEQMRQGFQEVIDRTNERIDRTNERIDRTNERIDRANERFDQLDQSIEELKTVTFKGYITMITRENSLYHEPHDVAEVPFPNGMFPWGKEVDGPGHSRVKLPRLTGVQAVRELSTPETYGFFRGYYPGEQMPPIKTRRERILAAIGLAEFIAGL